MNEPKALVGNTNRYLKLIHRHWLVVPPGTNIKVSTRYLWRALGIGLCYQLSIGVTNRYLSLVHRFHPPQKYRYEDEPVPTSTFGVGVFLVVKQRVTLD